ncbi:hypothetical protein Tco_0514165 [Tanacetum coccineum]
MGLSFTEMCRPLILAYEALKIDLELNHNILNPTNSSLNEAEKTAVVTAVTTADAIGQMVKTTMQVTLMVTPALDTPIECLRTPSKQNPSLGRLGSNFNNLSKKEKSPGAGTKVLSLNFLDYDI